MKTLPGGNREREHPPLIKRGGFPAIPEHGIPETNSPVRILLSEAATQHLEAMGKDCFLVIAKDKSDQHSVRMVIHLVPCSYKLANAALRVAQGLSTEKRPRPSPAPSPAALTPAEIRMA